MKKARITLLFAALFTFVGVSAMANCPIPVVFNHFAAGYFNGLQGNAVGSFWNQGEANAGSTGGGQLSTGNPFGSDNGVYSSGTWLTGGGYLFGDWSNGGVDGCIATGTDRMFVLISQGTNEASVNHGGQFYLSSVTFAGNGTYDFDAVSNGSPSGFPGCGAGSGCVQDPVTIPVPTVSATANAGGGVHNITLTWTDVANAAGYFDTTPGNVVAYQAYFRTGAEPTSGAIGGWTAIGGQVAQGVGTVTFAMNDTDINNTAWVALGLVINDGSTDPFRTAFVSGHSNAIGPLAADNVLGSSSATFNSQADDVKVDWNTLSEVGVSGFNVYWSQSATGSFTRANGNMIAPKGAGAGANYAFSFNKPQVDGNAIYVKVEAVKTGGSEFTEPMMVSFSPTPIRTNPDSPIGIKKDELKDRSLRTR